MHILPAVLLAALAGSASAVVKDWQQCGGASWSGETECEATAGCVKINDYYSQCQPGAAPQPQPQPTSAQPPTSSTISKPGTPSSTSAPAGQGPGQDLQPGYLWIRAVAAPNFHKYMQSSPPYSASPAVLSSHTTAGQFQVLPDGQLVQLVSGPGEPEKRLYAHVGQERLINDLCLEVRFAETPNAYGQFAFEGDTLTWSVGGVSRPNAAAWYVCEGQRMFINLGSYLYGTPAGCADQTIHYYNDKRAND